MAERKIPAPIPNVETQPYWDAAAKGKLLVKACTACGQSHHYPRATARSASATRRSGARARARG